MCFCEVDLLTCKSQHNECQATDVFLSTHNFPAKPPQAHNMKNHHRSHTCTAVLKSSLRSHPTHLCCQSLSVFTSTRESTESGSGWEMDVNSSSWTRFSAQRCPIPQRIVLLSRIFIMYRLNKTGSRNELNCSFTTRTESVCALLESLINWTENRFCDDS